MNWVPWRRTKAIVVLLATHHVNAVKTAALTFPHSERREAFTTGSAFAHIDGCSLIVLDACDLTETDGVERGALEATASGSGAVVVSGAAFAADPLRYESEARLSVGELRTFPPCTIANINYAGGVGKTTLALDLAAYFAHRTNLPTAVVELSQGASALHALIDPHLPHFYDMLTQSAAPGTWRNVTLVPMVYSSARMVLERDLRQAVDFLRDLQGRHILTIYDVVAAHPLWPELRALVQQVYIIVSPKPDSVLQGQAVLDDLRELGNGAGPGDVRTIANLIGGTRDRVALADAGVSLALPRIGNPARFSGRLGRRIAPLVYPGWGGRKQ